MGRDSIALYQYFALDGQPRGVQVTVVASYGRTWIKLVHKKPFGLTSSGWLGAGRRRGLAALAGRLVRAAQQHPIDGQAPVVVVRFSRAASREVAAALQGMGIQVEGQVLDLTTHGPAAPAMAGLPFSRLAQELPSGAYAMWWSEPGSPALAGSAALAAIDRSYQVCNGIAPAVLAAVLKALDLVGPAVRAVELPVEPAWFVLRTAQGQPLVLSAAQEKGLRLHMDRGAFTPAQRDQLWQAWAAALADWRRQAGPALPDIAGPDPAHGWWRACRAAALREEQHGQPVAQLGMLLPARS
jgi:hypothetical protein